jgi:hypothetical protein
MYIFQEAETPQGVAATCHRVHKVEITDVVTVVLNSFANENSEMLVWQDSYDVPMVVFSSGSYPQNVYDYMTGPNGPFSGAALIAEMEELDKLKATTKVSINTLRDKTIAMGCDTPSGRVDTDEVSLRNIMATYQSAVLAKLTTSPFSVEWRIADNSSVVLDADQMIAVGNAVLSRTQACYENSWSLKAEVEAATTVEEVTLVLIGSGWPV